MTEILLLIEDIFNFGFLRGKGSENFHLAQLSFPQKTEHFFYLDVPLLILFSFPRLTFKQLRNTTGYLEK